MFIQHSAYQLWAIFIQYWTYLSGKALTIHYHVNKLITVLPHDTIDMQISYVYSLRNVSVISYVY